MVTSNTSSTLAQIGAPPELPRDRAVFRATIGRSFNETFVWKAEDFVPQQPSDDARRAASAARLPSIAELMLIATEEEPME